MPISEGASPEQQETRIEELLKELTLEEKVSMLSGHGFFEHIRQDGGRYCAHLYAIGAGIERLGIPPFLFMDGPRGIGMGESTCFPVSMARGASFDTDLERRIGDAIGRELRAHGGNLFGGVCINLLRHPAWGRAQETYGEDSFLLGEMGVALTRGVQHHNVVATPKHYACNSMENARFKVNVEIDERTLREIYLPHFKKCIDAGAGAVMSAYNKVNGAYCGHNFELLTQILKQDWGFDGFVYSDFVMGCRGPDAAAAGLDVEAPDTIHYGDKLLEAIREGHVSKERIDDAVSRVLRILVRTLAATDPEEYKPDMIACPAHVALAREAAEKSIVLLRNEEAVLPLDENLIRSLLVLGKHADAPNLGDHGSSRVFPPEVVTPLAGLRTGTADDCEVIHDSGDDLDRVRVLAGKADAVVVLAGYTHEEEGEYIPVEMNAGGSDTGGDRLDLTLGEEQEALILAAAAANPKTIVALVTGSAVLLENWRNEVPAILMLWYAGMQGGVALADVLFGRVSPSGRLPFTIPAMASDLPFFDRDAQEIVYDAWHGYMRLDAKEVTPSFAFGFGLGYSKFAFGEPTLRLDEGEDRIRVDVQVQNLGERAGETVVQVYAGPATLREERPIRKLCGFQRVALQPRETKTAVVRIPLQELASFDVARQQWRLDDSPWRVSVGASSASADLKSRGLDLPERRWSVAGDALCDY